MDCYACQLTQGKKPFRGDVFSPYAATGFSNAALDPAAWGRLSSNPCDAACISESPLARMQQRWDCRSTRFLGLFLNFSNQARDAFACGLMLDGIQNIGLLLYSRGESLQNVADRSGSPLWTAMLRTDETLHQAAVQNSESMPAESCEKTSHGEGRCAGGLGTARRTDHQLTSVSLLPR